MSERERFEREMKKHKFSLAMSPDDWAFIAWQASARERTEQLLGYLEDAGWSEMARRIWEHVEREAGTQEKP